MKERRKMALRGPGGIRIVLDKDQVIPDNPGDGTPSMVLLPFGRGSSTYDCAADTGEVIGPNGESVELTKRQCDWLHKQEKEVYDFLYPDEMPKPVLDDPRICFGIMYFSTEEDAKKADEIVRKQGDTYKGGFFHGTPCGRDTTFDYEHPTLGKLLAVTRR